MLTAGARNLTLHHQEGERQQRFDSNLSQTFRRAPCEGAELGVVVPPEAIASCYWSCQSILPCAAERQSFNARKGFSALDIPRIFNITESAHRIHNPLTPEKLATLGAALRLESGCQVLDLGSGSGEMLCTWARDHGITGIGIDMSELFTEQAKRRAEELGVADRVMFIHGDAAGHVADEKVSVAACIGATWIGAGVAGTIELLAQSLRPGGIILIGEPYWRQLPPTEEVAKRCLAGSISDFLVLPELLASFGQLGYDVVEMVLADQDSWDRYEAAKWLTMRRWLEANPGDELAKEVRAQLTSEPVRYAAYTREYLGWGVFALMSRR